jgi:hypothetical protein
MSFRFQLCAVALLCLPAPEVAQAESCRSESFEGASYVVCSFDLGSVKLMRTKQRSARSGLRQADGLFVRGSAGEIVVCLVPIPLASLGTLVEKGREL